jgi:hypothetical protein
VSTFICCAANNFSSVSNSDGPDLIKVDQAGLYRQHSGNLRSVEALLTTLRRNRKRHLDLGDLAG